MRIRVSGRARVRIRKQDEWWREHRLDAPELFKQELGRAFERILRAPKARPEVVSFFSSAQSR